jgi:hypothetical protein
MMLLTGLSSGMLACSGGSSPNPSGNSGTTPGNYTITITGTSGTATAGGPVTLTVQ